MKIIVFIIKVAFLQVIFVPQAFAYIDPGSGMLFWQGIVAAIGAVIIFIRNPINLIKIWINWLRKK